MVSGYRTSGIRRQSTAPVSDRNPLPAQPPRLLLPTMCRQLAVRPHDPPPGKAQTIRKHIADRPGGAGISGPPGDFPVADHLTTADVPDDRPHRLDKGSLLFDARRAQPRLRPGKSRPGRPESRSGLWSRPAARSPPTSVTERAP